MRTTPEHADQMLTSVSDDQAIVFLENAFRNIDLPPLSGDDLSDIRRGLKSFLRQRAETGR